MGPIMKVDFFKLWNLSMFSTLKSYHCYCCSKIYPQLDNSIVFLDLEQYKQNAFHTQLVNAKLGFVWHFWNQLCLLLKEPGPIAADFSRTFRDFGIRRKLVFFSLPLVIFTAGKWTVSKILMKMWLVMVTIIRLTQ